MKYVKFTLKSRVAIFTCTGKKTAPLHFSGLVTLFKRISEASSVMISVVKCMWNFLESNTCAECDRKKNLISPKLEHFFVCRKLQFLLWAALKLPGRQS